MRLHPFEHRELHPQLWGEIRERGWPGLLVPATRGGSDGGLLAYVVMMEALAASNLILWMPVLTPAIGYAIARSARSTRASAGSIGSPRGRRSWRWR